MKIMFIPVFLISCIIISTCFISLCIMRVKFGKKFLVEYISDEGEFTKGKFYIVHNINNDSIKSKYISDYSQLLKQVFNDTIITVTSDKTFWLRLPLSQVNLIRDDIISLTFDKNKILPIKGK